MNDHLNSSRSIVHAAARSIEERDLIGAIVDSPLANLPRSNYAAWLEANDGSRIGAARYLADFAERVANHTADEPPRFQFPFDTDDIPESWNKMLGTPLFETVTEDNEIWQLKDLLFKYANPRLGITAEPVDADKMPIECSRFGGRASLPADVEWPTCTKGDLNFIAQIALSEIENTQVSRFLPVDGWFAFFALNGHVGGNNVTDDFRILYSPGSSTLSWRDPPNETEFTNRGVSRLVFAETWDLPYDDYVITETDRDKLDHFSSEFNIDFDELRSSFGEYDGHLLGDLRHGRTDFVARSATDRNLICFNSVKSLGWNWCDGDHLSIFLEHDDLVQCIFDKADGYAA